jgi:NAD(P)-dependent dehydrogenase (short-subunit alcohol dehydrogenase family)
VAAVPLQRVGARDEIAHAIAFVLDERSEIMTGQTLHIDGGLTVSAARV